MLYYDSVFLNEMLALELHIRVQHDICHRLYKLTLSTSFYSRMSIIRTQWDQGVSGYLNILDN